MHHLNLPSFNICTGEAECKAWGNPFEFIWLWYADKWTVHYNLGLVYADESKK